MSPLFNSSELPYLCLFSSLEYSTVSKPYRENPYFNYHCLTWRNITSQLYNSNSLNLLFVFVNYPFWVTFPSRTWKRIATPLQLQLSFDLCPATSYPYSLTFHPLAHEGLLVNQLSPCTINENVNNSESVILVKYNQVQIQVFKEQISSTLQILQSPS